jgi:hypothetical protein
MAERLHEKVVRFVRVRVQIISLSMMLQNSDKLQGGVNTFIEVVLSPYFRVQVKPTGKFHHSLLQHFC